MATASLTYEELTSAIERFKNDQGNLNTIIEKYKATIENIGEGGAVYSGDAANRSRAALENVRARLEKLSEYISKLAAYADEAKNRFAEADSRAYHE